MFNYSVEKLVDNMVIADQTDMVYKMLLSDFGPKYRDIKCPIDKFDVEPGIGPEIYSWKLINPWYGCIIEYKAPNYGMAYLQFEGQLWLGKTSPNALTEWEYLKGLCKEE